MVHRRPRTVAERAWRQVNIQRERTVKHAKYTFGQPAEPVAPTMPWFRALKAVAESAVAMTELEPGIGVRQDHPFKRNTQPAGIAGAGIDLGRHARSRGDQHLAAPFRDLETIGSVIVKPDRP